MIRSVGHHHAETNETSWTLRETPRAHRQRDDSVGTDAWKEVQGKTSSNIP